jgi:hypothetical protein
MMVLAPARFSTTTGYPNKDSAFGAKSLATTSVWPPAGNGTITLIGFTGKGSWALVDDAPKLSLWTTVRRYASARIVTNATGL